MNRYIHGGSYTGKHDPYIRKLKKVGRNKPCPCKSRKKLKNCCIGNEGEL